MRRARDARRENPDDFGPATEGLFDLVARTELLPRVAPGGRLTHDFVELCLAWAREQHGALRAEKTALAVCARAHPGLPGARDRARLARLARGYPGEPEEGLARGELALPGTRFLVDRRGVILERTLIPGSSIVVSPLRSERMRLRVVRDPRLARTVAHRFGAALALIDAVWPEAAAEVRARTRLVLPLAERDLVSYSLPSRPGVSFINLRGKTLVDLADDLLHETAHHRLHAIERRGSLVTPAARTEDPPRFWSPWRCAMRPARGIFHAVYTFSFRAELLTRLAAASRPGNARIALDRAHADAGKLGKEARHERRRVAEGLRHLRGAARMGLLTRAGKSLLKGMLRKPAR